jgi:uncharacterized protein
MIAMRILYHDDLDGKCAGFLVYDSLVKGGTCPKLFPMNYGEPTPFAVGEPFWIVDFSVLVDDMKQLLDDSPEVHWIDHHKSSIETYANFQYGIWSGKSIYGLRQDGISACELTWRYLYQDKPVPDFVKYIGDRDVWAWTFGQETKHFCNGLLAYDTDPGSSISVFKELMNDYEYEMKGVENAFSRHSSVMADGRVITAYKDRQDVEYVNKNGIFVEWEGYECYIVNGMYSSEPFEKAVPNAAVWIAFRYMPGCYWNVSLYSTKVNVREIAQKYGGGGHDKAAGFQCKELPFLLKEGKSDEV